MKRTLLSILLLVFILTLSKAQTAFVHTSSTANTSGHITTIDNAATNGKANLVLIVQQVYGVYNTNEIGVWFSGGKWKIFNQNRRPLPQNAVFHVLVIDPAQYRRAFVHTTSAANTRGHVSNIDHVMTNNKPNEVVFITQRYGKYNTSPVGVWYSSGKWTVFNENKQPIPAGTMFNVVVLPSGALEGINSYQGAAFTHTVSSGNIMSGRKHVSKINHNSLNNKPKAFVFLTNNWVNTYNTNTTGAWYSQPNWTVFNQNRQAIAPNLRVNVLSMELVLKMILTNPKVITTIPGRTDPPKTKPDRNLATYEAAAITKNPKVYNANVLTAIKKDPGRWVIAPYGNSGGSSKPAEEPVDTEVQGPNVMLGKELGDLLGEVQLEPFVEKLNIFREVYEDKNKNAGFYYYLPSSYTLNWNRESGEYSFFVYYLSAGNDGRGDVIVTAELTPNISEEDIELAESLLAKKLKKDIKLYPMPLRNTPEATFGNNLSLFDVDPNSLSTNIPTDFLQPIVVTWKMNQRVDDLLGYMMSRNQVAGNMVFEPFSDEDKVFTVPVQLKLNDEKTYGKLEFENAAGLLNGFVNPLDYPVILTGISVMRQGSSKTFVENVSLNNYQVGPGEIFSGFSNEEKNKVINGDLISKVWLNYSIKADCDDCNRNIQEKILGGTSNSLVRKLEVEVLTPLAYSGAQSIKLVIKSRQGDPNGEQEVLLPIVNITSDGSTLKGGELFINEGEDPEYQYQLVIVKPDGDVQTSDWQAGNDLFLIIGEKAIQDLFEQAESDE